jgi:hypothetical protein
MFFVSGCLSIALIAVANYAVRRSERPFPIVLLAGLGVIVVPQFVLWFFPAVMIQAVLLVLCVLAWRLLEMEDPRQFLVLSCAATVLAYSIVGVSAWFSARALRNQFAYESLADRLPALPPTDQELPAATATRLTAVENQIDSTDALRGDDLLRLEQLEQLNERPFAAFLQRPPFGISYFGTRMTDETLSYGLRQDRPLPQAGKPMRFTWSAAALQKQPSDNDKAVAAQIDMHQGCIADFVNRKGFGYVKDRQHVVGFQEHRVSQVHTPPAPWGLEMVELMGLVRAGSEETADPVVYVSGNVPRLEELRKASTRKLDDFETEGLKALRAGEDLFIRDAEEGRRMLGSIRNGKQCIACHGGTRGQLLGAFSYTMLRRFRY